MLGWAMAAILYLWGKMDRIRSGRPLAVAPQTGAYACRIGFLTHDGICNFVESGGIQRSSHGFPHIPRPANILAKFLREIRDHIEYYSRDRVRAVVNDFYKFERSSCYPVYLVCPAPKDFLCKRLGDSNSRRHGKVMSVGVAKSFARILSSLLQTDLL